MVRKGKWSAVLVALVLGWAGGPAQGEDGAPAYELNLESVCQGGFRGTFDGGAGLGGAPLRLRFESCPRTDACRAVVSRTDGAELVGVEQDGETVQTRLGGFDVAELEAADMPQVQAVMESPESYLAPALWASLVDLGLEPSSRGMRCLSAAMQGFEFTQVKVIGKGLCEDCNDPRQDCLGCCGLGCTGGNKCATVCTQSCKEHDQCFRDPIQRWTLGCAIKFDRAAKSAAKCAVACALTKDCCCPYI